MNYLEALSEEARELIRSRLVTEYATVSAAGVPIDTPTYVFPRTDLSTIDIATGLAYPAKAERARRNPKVGLVLEGRPDQPVVAIAGMAAVRDADLQANLDRYARETIFTQTISPDFHDWEGEVRPAVHYLTRIIVEVMPAHVRWWPKRSAMDEAPNEWRAPAGTVFPQSDPVPPGKTSPAPQWGQPAWQDLARSALASGWSSHLTLCDADGFPIPMMTRDVTECEGGFRVVVPRSAPWTEGKATLSFMGWNVFVGEARVAGGAHIFTVERALPILPLTRSAEQVLNPDPESRKPLEERLHYECERRGQPVPVVAETPPPGTELAHVRAAHAHEWKPMKD